jgi:putative hydrolase of the HAD superfamily
VTTATAAVAVLLDLSGATPHVLLGRRRAREGDPWSGHLALPGGRPDASDRDAMDTAVRECAEEAGILLERAMVWGGLPPVVAGRVTGRHTVVSPFVAVLEGRFDPSEGEFRADRGTDGEIEAWMGFALEDLDRPELRTAIRAPDGSVQEGVRTALGTLWGMTLRLLERVWRAPLVPGISRLWLDFDGTLYPASHPLSDAVDRRITEWISRERGVAPEEADLVRMDLYRRHGNTLRGMMGESDMDPTRYLDFVFDLPDSVFPGADPGLDLALSRLGLPARVFTNARADYVRRGLERLGISGRIRGIHDIESFGWRSKPEPAVYEELLRLEGADPSTILFADDRAENLAPARALGIRCVWMDEDGRGDWTDRDGHPWDGLPWQWKIRDARLLPALLLPRLGT